MADARPMYRSEVRYLQCTCDYCTHVNQNDTRIVCRACGAVWERVDERWWRRTTAQKPVAFAWPWKEETANV